MLPTPQSYKSSELCCNLHRAMQETFYNSAHLLLKQNNACVLVWALTFKHRCDSDIILLMEIYIA